MIEAGCDPNVAGVYGKTAAHCLVQRESALDAVSFIRGLGFVE